MSLHQGALWVRGFFERLTLRLTLDMRGVEGLEIRCASESHGAEPTVRSYHAS
jgi:hypothetical protein